MFHNLCLQVTKAHAGDYTCTPYNTHGTSGTSGIMQVMKKEKWEITYNCWWLDDNIDYSGPRAGSAQHQAQAWGGVCEECGGEGDDTDDNSDNKMIMIWCRSHSPAPPPGPPPPPSAGGGRGGCPCLRSGTRLTRAPSPSPASRSRITASTSVWWVKSDNVTQQRGHRVNLHRGDAQNDEGSRLFISLTCCNPI